MKNQIYQKFIYYSNQNFLGCIDKRKNQLKLDLQEEFLSHIYYIFSYIQKEEIKCNNVIKQYKIVLL